MIKNLGFEPLLPIEIWVILATLLLVATFISIWNNLRSWPWRFLSCATVLFALLQPKILTEERESLEDIVIVLVDQSSSQSIQDRRNQTLEVAQQLDDLFGKRVGLRVRKVSLFDDEKNLGTRMINKLESVLAEEAKDQIAGIVLVTDGIVHDATDFPSIAAPVHVFLTGKKDSYDLRLVVKNAPAFAIVGEPLNITLRAEAYGLAPKIDEEVGINISIDGGPVQRFMVPIGKNVDIKLTLPHNGKNVFQFILDPLQGELTEQNNHMLMSINGIRDRLRVLLVTGEPHAGTRTWRNLLKSDSSVDLVHFTILKPPGKQDGVPVNELSLIAFPTRELFLEKIDDFDLIIFDRYKRRGILPASYLDNVANYVENGGALLLSAGPDFATVNSLFRSPLGRVLPAEPTSRIMSSPYTPKISNVGHRHPVTAQLPDQGSWGRWFRQVEVVPRSGHVLMLGAEDQPLLVLDRVGNGRIALLASDHTWLWDRKFEGGGPQLELLRRLAHWMMSEPELEEEALMAEQIDNFVRILRRTMGTEPKYVEVTSPTGNETRIPFVKLDDGTGFEAIYRSGEFGLYRMEEGGLEGVFSLGPAISKEFENVLPSKERLSPFVEQTNGGSFWIADGLPQLRKVLPGRRAAGKNWFALTPRGAFKTINVNKVPLLPVWLVGLLAGGLLLVGWLVEGRRGKSS